MKKNIFSYFITIVLLIIIYFLIKDSHLIYLQKMHWPDLLISCFFAFLLYSLSGLQYYLIRKNYGLSLGIKDIVLLPITMNLWSFVFPFQGSLIFTSIFFKKKYGLRISDNFSIYIYLYLLTVFIGGIVGMIFFLLTDFQLVWLGFVSLLFILHPFLLTFFNYLFSQIPNIKPSIFQKVKKLIEQVFSGVNNLRDNIKITFFLLMLNIVRLFVYAVWYYWISSIFSLELNFFHIALISLIGNILLIFKFTPDNIGINQLLSGGFISYLGANPTDAIVLTLYASATTICIIFTIGLTANFYYIKSINIFSLYQKNEI